ncbi:hypothetical protein [uncultured Pseudokineococcus sp.]|uniref:hypothetical protein n=1 Tax=uncultured Pseudokineococcus sp. TaxID=1642928 RepID=UPI00260978C3|nr:hypothetical protein [uncultured Pseudokineococcus sp.]
MGWQAMLHRLRADQAVHLAGLYAQGQRCLTLHHPDVTTVDDESALLAALEDLEVDSDQHVVAPTPPRPRPGGGTAPRAATPTTSSTPPGPG